MTIQAPLIKADGTTAVLSGPGPTWTLAELREAIGAEYAEVLQLRDDMIMVVDDSGAINGKPKNAAATRAYQIDTGNTQEIFGDAIITESELLRRRLGTICSLTLCRRNTGEKEETADRQI